MGARGRLMKRFPHPERFMGLAGLAGLAALTVIAVLAFKLTDRPVLTSGPCTMLGLAELAAHPGVPLLVIDCDGFQFGVPAVLP